jgi:hypothetical protein
VEAPTAKRLRWLFVFVVSFGAFYGAVMATYTGLSPGRFHQLLYVAVKVPLLLLVSFGLCLPSFFVVNTILGLREDFGRALRAVVATQACVAMVLASLAPVTAFYYVSAATYDTALTFNGGIFAVASVTAQIVVRRYYADLIRTDPRHRIMMYFWFFMYIFVAMQMAWVLRPFIGSPDIPVSFFREEQWGNAYVEIARLVARLFS